MSIDHGAARRRAGARYWGWRGGRRGRGTGLVFVTGAGVVGGEGATPGWCALLGLVWWAARARHRAGVRYWGWCGGRPGRGTGLVGVTGAGVVGGEGAAPGWCALLGWPDELCNRPAGVGRAGVHSVTVTDHGAGSCWARVVPHRHALKRRAAGGCLSRTGTSGVIAAFCCFCGLLRLIMVVAARRCWSAYCGLLQLMAVPRSRSGLEPAGTPGFFY